MIELNSVVLILMVEALVALLLLLAGLWLWSRKKKSGEFKVAHELIDELEDSKPLRNTKLGKLITEHCTLDEDALQTLLQDVDARERALYQQIIQVFLNRDPKILQGVDDYIQDLSQPYCKILEQSGQKSAPVIEDTETKNQLIAAKRHLARITKENAALTEQLRLALKTVDEVSDEYTRIFNGSKTETELRNSYKHMMHVFQMIEREVKQSQAAL